MLNPRLIKKNIPWCCLLLLGRFPSTTSDISNSCVRHNSVFNVTKFIILGFIFYIIYCIMFFLLCIFKSFVFFILLCFFSSCFSSFIKPFDVCFQYFFFSLTFLVLFFKIYSCSEKYKKYLNITQDVTFHSTSAEKIFKVLIDNC